MQGKLIKNMSFVEALPPLSTKQWRMLVIVLLDALSVQRLPRLGVHLMNNRSVLRKVSSHNPLSNQFVRILMQPGGLKKLLNFFCYGYHGLLYPQLLDVGVLLQCSI